MNTQTPTISSSLNIASRQHEFIQHMIMASKIKPQDPTPYLEVLEFYESVLREEEMASLAKFYVRRIFPQLSIRNSLFLETNKRTINDQIFLLQNDAIRGAMSWHIRVRAWVLQKQLTKKIALLKEQTSADMIHVNALQSLAEKISDFEPCWFYDLQNKNTIVYQHTNKVDLVVDSVATKMNAFFGDQIQACIEEIQKQGYTCQHLRFERIAPGKMVYSRAISSNNYISLFVGVDQQGTDSLVWGCGEHYKTLMPLRGHLVREGYMHKMYNRSKDWQTYVYIQISVNK